MTRKNAISLGTYNSSRTWQKAKSVSLIIKVTPIEVFDNELHANLHLAITHVSVLISRCSIFSLSEPLSLKFPATPYPIINKKNHAHRRKLRALSHSKFAIWRDKCPIFCREQLTASILICALTEDVCIYYIYERRRREELWNQLLDVLDAIVVSNIYAHRRDRDGNYKYCCLMAIDLHR